MFLRVLGKDLFRLCSGPMDFFGSNLSLRELFGNKNLASFGPYMRVAKIAEYPSPPDPLGCDTFNLNVNSLSAGLCCCILSLCNTSPVQESR